MVGQLDKAGQSRMGVYCVVAYTGAGHPRGSPAPRSSGRLGQLSWRGRVSWRCLGGCDSGGRYRWHRTTEYETLNNQPAADAA